MLGLILAVQGMNFATEDQALLFLRNARKPSACQSPVFVELLWLRYFMTLVSGVCNSHDTFQKVHESSRITQERTKWKFQVRLCHFSTKKLGKFWNLFFKCKFH